MRLPSKRDYPDYYKVIKNPISMKKIRTNRYKSGLDFKQDFYTLFRNAQTYNEESSIVYKDSVKLQVNFGFEFFIFLVHFM
jgi:ATP-dependent helicase STH1/SNF2